MESEIKRHTNKTLYMEHTLFTNERQYKTVQNISKRLNNLIIFATMFFGFLQ